MKVGVTGANGFVGSRIARALEDCGHEVVRLIRRPVSAGDREYELGKPVLSSTLMDIDVVVHAAWDFSVVEKKITTVNYGGSQPLLETASNLGIRIILVSTLSAFEGCRSDYGRAKFRLEQLVTECGGASFRAGVIFGEGAGGIFGSLLNTIRKESPIPIFSGGHQPLSVSWDKSIGKLVELLVREPNFSDKPILAAHKTEVTLRSLIEDIATAEGIQPRVIPVNWRLGWVGLRGLEALRFSPPFRSDSLLALVNPIPEFQRLALATPPFEFPPLTPDLWC